MKKKLHTLTDGLRWSSFALLLAAGIINAIGVTMFLAPVHLYDSGISGTSMLLWQITPERYTLSLFLLLLNTPLFLFGWRKQGTVFTVYSLWAVLVYSGASYLITNVLPIDVSTASPFAGKDLLLCALFSFLSGPALLMLGRESYRGPITQKAGPWSLAQPAAGLAWLFATHLKHGTDPVLMDYGPALAAVALLMLGSYELAALRYAHPHPRRGLFCCLMSVYLGLLSLGDSLEPFRLALAAAFLLSNLAGAMALLSHMGPVRSGGARLAPKKEINNEGDHNNGE